MIKNSVPAYFCKIYISTSPGYMSIPEPRDKQIHVSLQKFMIQESIAVNVQETTFNYPGGCEEGYIIEFINYPRFPLEPPIILDKALRLAEALMKEYDQFRCTVMTPTRTFLLENTELTKE